MFNLTNNGILIHKTLNRRSY